MEPLSSLINCFLLSDKLTGVKIWDKRIDKKKDTTVLYKKNTVNMVPLLFIITDCLKLNPPGLRVFSGQNYVPKLFTPYCNLIKNMKQTAVINIVKNRILLT